MPRGELRSALKVKSKLGHFWRGFVGSLAMGMSFAGLGLLPLPEVTAIGYAAPLLTVIFAAMFLDEKVGVFRISAVALGLIGVLIVISPRLSVFGGETIESTQALGVVLVLMGAVCAALAQIYIRKLVQFEQTAAIVFYFSITSATLSLLTLPFGWVMPTVTEFSLLVSGGGAGRCGADFPHVGLPVCRCQRGGAFRLRLDDFRVADRLLHL